MGQDTDQAVRDILKGASIVYIGLFLELLIAFVAQVIAARYLSVSGFGGLTTGTALLNVGGIVSALGFSAGLVRYLPRIQEDKKRMITVLAVGITIVSSTLVGLAAALNAAFIATRIFGDPDVTVSIRIFGAAIPFAAILNVAIGGIRGQKRSLYRVYVKNLIHPITRFVLVLVVVVYGLDQAGFAGAYALPYVLSSALALLFLHRTLPAIRSSFDTDLTMRVTRYSLPFTISGIASFVNRSLDIFLILHFLGSFAVGIYGVAYAAVSFMEMFSTAFNYMGTPVASELEKNDSDDDAIHIFRSAAKWLVILSICMLVPLGIFSTEFITIIYESKYESGGIVLTILAVGFAVKNVLKIHWPILEALGRSKILSFNNTVAATFNVILNLILIPRFGIVGAAIATVLSFLLRDGLALFQVWKSLGNLPVSWVSMRPVLIGIPLLGLFGGFVAPVVPVSLLWLVMSTAVFATLYIGIVVFTFGLSPTEEMIIRSVEERYDIDLGPLDGLVNYLSKQR